MAVLASCGLAERAGAQQSWVGSSQSLWGTASNWSPATSPVTTSDVTVGGTNPLTIQFAQSSVVNGLSVTNPSLTLVNGPGIFLGGTMLILRSGGLTLNNGATLVLGDPIAGLSATVAIGQQGGINSVGGGRILLRGGTGSGASTAGLGATNDLQGSIPIAAGVLIEGRGSLSGSWTNRGTIGAGPGTGVSITSGTITQLDSGTIVASDEAGQGRVVTLASGGRVVGGTIRASGSSRIAVRAEGSTPAALAGVVSEGGISLDQGRLRVEPSGLVLASGSVLTVTPFSEFSSSSVLELAGPVAGAGTIVLNATPTALSAAQIVPQASGPGTIGPQTRVTGIGTIGSTSISLSLRNRGIIADGPTIQGAIEQDPTARISAVTADVALRDGARVTGGRLESVPPRAVLFTGTSFSSSPNAFVSGVTLAGELRNSIGRVRIEGSPGLTGEPGSVLTIGGSSSGSATTELADGASIEGPVTVRFVPVAQNSVGSLVTPTAQSVGFLGQQVVVQGLGTLSGVFSSQARIESDVVVSGVFTQVAPGRIAPSSGQVTLGNSARVVGGRFEPAPGAAVVVAGSSSTTTPVVSDVVCSGLLRLASGARLRIESPGLTIEPTGRLLVNPNASVTDTFVDFDNGAVLNGRVDLNGNAADLTSAQLTTLTGATGALGVQAVVRGPGQITGSFVNLGRIGRDVLVLGTLSQGETGSIDPEAGAVTLGNLARVSGGTLRTSGGVIQTGSTSTGPVSTSTISGVTSAATIQVQDNWRLRIAGAGLSGQTGSRIVVNASSNPTLPSILEIADGSTVSGTSVIQLLGSYTDLALTRLEVAAGSGASIGQGVRIEGRGLLDGRLTVAGTLSPGSATSEAQLLYRSGLSLTPESRVEIDLSGPIAAQRDLIAAAMPAPLGANIALDGTLSVRLVNPYRPTRCETIPVVSGPYTRLFTRVEQPTTAPGSFEVVYGQNTVGVRYRPFDTNGNLVADVDDIFEFLGEWFRSSPRADADGLGGANIDDIFWFLDSWFGAPCW